MGSVHQEVGGDGSANHSAPWWMLAMEMRDVISNPWTNAKRQVGVVLKWLFYKEIGENNNL